MWPLNFIVPFNFPDLCRLRIISVTSKLAAYKASEKRKKDSILMQSLTPLNSEEMNSIRRRQTYWSLRRWCKRLKIRGAATSSTPWNHSRCTPTNSSIILRYVCLCKIKVFTDRCARELCHDCNRSTEALRRESDAVRLLRLQIHRPRQSKVRVKRRDKKIDSKASHG